MTLTTAIDLDYDLQQDVLDELDWDPEVDVTDVGVEVESGVITLTGTVNSFAKKWAAERAAQRVASVRAVANDIEVNLLGSAVKSDTDIALAVANALEWDTSVPPSRIQITVDDGRVTLDGGVDWNYQRLAAEIAASRIEGVTEVINLITIKPREASADQIRTSIERSLVRNAEIDANNIRVRIERGQVTLSGTVHAWAEKQEAEETAWRAPGVVSVINNIQVRIP